MNNELIITLVILAGAIVLFLSERLSVDLVALLVLVALGLSRVLTPQEVFSGFSDTAVITILAIFVLAHALEVTGIAERMGDVLVRTAGGSEVRLIVALMSAAAFMSLFMNNIAVASILLPATSSIAKRTNIKISRLLMPLAFGTLLGGTATLFTTTNIVVSGVLKSNGYRGFGVLDFAPVGLPLVIVGIVYMAIWGRRLLPAESRTEVEDVIHQADYDLLQMYHLGERLFRARIPSSSSLIEKDLAESALREKFGLNVVAVELSGGTLLAPEPDFIIHEGDILLLAGRLDEFRQLNAEAYLDVLPMRQYSESDLESASVAVIEAVLSPRSQLVGRTLKETQFREKFGMMVLAVWNGERVIRTRRSDLKLAFGDALLLQGPRKKLPLLRQDPNLIVLSKDEEKSQAVSNKGWLALTIFGLTILVAALGRFSVSEVMLTGALAMVIASVVTMEQVYRAIEWRIVFLVAGMLPLGLAMTKTGATTIFAGALTGMLKPLGPLALLLGLLVITVLLSQAMKGAAVSAVVAPIAIQAAQQFGVDPRAMAMGVALATSLAFVTPLGHPVNILMMGPGGYRFRDFFKVGLPLTILLFFVILVTLPIFWPLAGK
ncbi:MAG: SLC13 family permease [Anaerolineae bacterium]|nr:SLC13 family permease [Anaerolineae bacterium]